MFDIRPNAFYMVVNVDVTLDKHASNCSIEHCSVFDC